MGTDLPEHSDPEKAGTEFLKAAEAFASSVKVPVDPIAQKRTELHENLLRAVQNAAQAKADLTAAAKGLANAEGAIGFRMAERDAQNALSTLIEWEAGLL